MVRKVEAKLGAWCHRWLSLGRRLILLKSILERAPVYWLSLAKVPKSILKKIRKVSFRFLWARIGKKSL